MSKLRVERPKKIIDKLVRSSQTAFIKGSQITGAALVANECLDSRLKQKRAGILCNFDTEKAFDHIHWNFLLDLLRKMGLDKKGISWIHFCISAVGLSALINGIPQGFFQTQRVLI